MSGVAGHLSIGEVLNQLRDEFPDVTISKIRFLESQGLIDPERTPSGYRKFYDGDVERLRFILHEQKEHFLPLKVIKDRLESGDPTDDETREPDDEPETNEQAHPVREEAPRPEERVPIWMMRAPSTPPAPPRRSGAAYSFEEVATHAGVSLEELREVERFGLVIGQAIGGATFYDEHAVVAARTAGEFLRYGVEPRHLRLYRNAADREAGLIEQ